ncbi:MAG: PfkB family carbohydrate kinase [Bacteroidales bacterium]
MKPGLLEKMLKSIEMARIAIVGDFCLDAYWFINESKSELSVETGLPTRPVGKQTYSPGGAGNVAHNLAEMKIKEILAFGVIGNDPFGIEMIKILNRKNINTQNLLIQDKHWATHVYIKPYSGEKEHNRIDFGNFNKLSRKTADKLLNCLIKAMTQIDLVIINQQVLSGINTEYFRNKLTGIIRNFPDKIFIADSRNYSDSYTGAYRKMNDREAASLCGIKKETDEVIPISEIKSIANILYQKYGKPLFITRGNRGSIAIDDTGIYEIPGLMILSKTDPVGAGDSFLAGVSAALAAGYPVNIAAELGSYVAGVTVQKLFQTGTATPQEILQIGRDPDFIYNPDLAENPRKAKYHEKTNIEIINQLPDSMKIRYAIFDNDGTISTLREGWENIMAPVMEKAILGNRYTDADQTLYNKVNARVREFIDQTTGIQTLSQMEMLPSIIREFGIVPENKILDEFEYKKLYNNELMKMVRQREEKLLKGELSLEDLTIKNSVSFLKILYDRGIILYLTSGTDVEDVKHEAEVLGYAYLFESRIFGATGDTKKEAKKIVLDNILDNIGKQETHMIITFGDGPVEIRETHKRGGLTVGVASDEVRRYGLNPTKRSRLIKAGADIIIPDFSQSEKLIKLLNIF